jgi:hypothetical protein
VTVSLSPHLLVIALVGLAATAVSLLIDVQTLLLTYLATVVAISAISIGAIGVLMLTYLVRGNWTEGLHVPLTAAALTTPAAGFLFIPVLIGIPWLYPWTQGTVADAGLLKTIWLTPWFFIGRTVLYFAIWTVLAVWLRRAWANPQRMVFSASVGLIVYALATSFAGIDWLESLTPEFHSSIYGLLFLTFELLAGLSFVLILALSRPDAPTFRYGAILLSLLLLWAYNHAMQYIIIWSGNIPEEVVWYLHRETSMWGLAFWGLITLQFIIPFFAMLLSRVRNARTPLLAIAALTLALRFIEAYVLALPGTEAGGAVLWLSIPGTIFVCGTLWWLAFNIVFEHIRLSPLDLRPLAEAFDASGSPLPSRAPRS